MVKLFFPKLRHNSLIPNNVIVQLLNDLSTYVIY